MFIVLIIAIVFNSLFFAGVFAFLLEGYADQAQYFDEKYKHESRKIPAHYWKKHK